MLAQDRARPRRKQGPTLPESPGARLGGKLVRHWPDDGGGAYRLNLDHVGYRTNNYARQLGYFFRNSVT